MINGIIPLEFLIIGSQKSGTSFVREVLMSHPDVYMPNGKKEMHYFDRDLSRVDEYMRAYDCAPSGSVKGEKTPAYMHMSDKRIKLVKSFFPDTKLVLILRNPVERAWSQARMEVSKWNKVDLSSKHVPMLLWNVADIRNKYRSDYFRAIKKWYKHFPPEQVLVLFYDDLERDSHAFIKQIYNHIGVLPHYPKILEERVFQGKPYSMPSLVKYYLHRTNRCNIDGLKSYGFGVPEAWFDDNDYRRPGSLGVFCMGLIDILSSVRNFLYKTYKYAQEIWHFHKMKKVFGVSNKI